MRRKRNIIRLGDRRNLFQFHNPSGMRNVGLYVIAGTSSKKFVVIEPRIQPLTRRNRHGRFITYRFQRFEVIRRNRFFKPHRFEFFQRFCDFYPRGHIESAVPFYQQIDFIAHRLAHRRHTFQRVGKVGVGNLQITLSERIPFHCRNAFLYGYLRLFGELLRRFRPRKPSVDVNAAIFVCLAAEKRVHGYAERLSENIP